MSNQRKKLGGISAASVLFAAALTSVAVAPASADTTPGGGTAPSLSAITATGSITPDADTSASTLDVAVTVTDVNSLENLTTVTACYYLAGVGTNACASTDGKKEVLATWTQATDAFTLDDGSGTQASIATSTDATYAHASTSMTLTFKLNVAENFREGDWNIKITATDDDSLSAANDDTDASDWTSSWYGAVDTARASQNFGAIAAGATGTPIPVSGGAFTSNGTAAVNYAIANMTFTSPGGQSFTATNDGGAAGTDTAAGAIPGVDEFAFDCTPNDTWDAASDIRVGTSARVIENSVLTSGSAENGDTLLQTCALSVGTEWTRAGSPTYTGAVTTTLTNA